MLVAGRIETTCLRKDFLKQNYFAYWWFRYGLGYCLDLLNHRCMFATSFKPLRMPF
jgi:hypothetical protein